MATGVIFFAAFFGIVAGSNSPGAIMTFVILAFTVAVVVAWAWVTVISASLLIRHTEGRVS